MPPVVPAPAPVRPRIRAVGDSRLLEDAVEEYCSDHQSGVVWIAGDPSSGKSTALAHLAARFAAQTDVEFVDDAAHDSSYLRPGALTIAAGPAASPKDAAVFVLAPWSRDELVEYLLSVHPAQCRSVMQRLGDEARKTWSPEIARIVLNRFALHADLRDVREAVRLQLEQLLPSKSELAIVRQVCLDCQRAADRAFVALSSSKAALLPVPAQRLLRYEAVQLPLAAEQIVEEISSHKNAYALRLRLPAALVEETGELIAGDGRTSKRLNKILKTKSLRRAHPMAASLLFSASRSWKPSANVVSSRCLAGGYFSKAAWQGIDLSSIDLEFATLTDANLEAVNLDDATLIRSDLSNSNLRRATLKGITAASAKFSGACLRDAVLTRARLASADFSNAELQRALLCRADLCDADLSSAILTNADLEFANLGGAKLESVDLRHAILDGVDGPRLDFRSARLKGLRANGVQLPGANLEDVVWRNAELCAANLSHALLTGSNLSGGDLNRANLSYAGLGEIEWENVDLRDANLTGAAFHFGSSRSGLVGSPIASEGSRTGFYTDDLEELYFKSPEQVRVANLRGADLRGADVRDVDFYLVDLREAKLSPAQRRQAGQTGAILSDE